MTCMTSHTLRLLYCNATRSRSFTKLTIPTSHQAPQMHHHLREEEERKLMRFTRLGTWALGLWSAKSRAEVFSADRLGFLAADGDLDAAAWLKVLRGAGVDTGGCLGVMVGVHLGSLGC
eukprot:Skav216100  [mRNA]  locus=scaffold2042:275129:275485:- [translate_table: standard]